MDTVPATWAIICRAARLVPGQARILRGVGRCAGREKIAILRNRLTALRNASAFTPGSPLRTHLD